MHGCSFKPWSVSEASNLPYPKHSFLIYFHMNDIYNQSDGFLSKHTFQFVQRKKQKKRKKERKEIMMVVTPGGWYYKSFIFISELTCW